jgi:hypothetical protein
LETVDVSIADAKVVYTTKELLLRIDKRFDRLEDFAANAATRADVDKIEQHLDKVEQRVGALEQDASGTKAVAKALLDDGANRWSKNEKVAGLLIGIVAVIPGIVAVINIFS